ncbi:MAG: glycosyltransferase family 9 protein [Chlamydiota bacterium]
MNHPKILIIKTSALGDIIQAFGVLDDLQHRFPQATIDWAVEKSLHSIAAAHPLVRRAIALDIKGLKKGWWTLSAWKFLAQGFRDLRKERYDLIFDLQGNCKSGVIGLFAKGKVKVGFGRKSVREWPNLMTTHLRFEVLRQMNIRLQYLQLIQQYFRDANPAELCGVRFKIEENEKAKLAAILDRPELKSKLKVMVCPGSKWINKQLPLTTLVSLLQKIEEKLDACFLLVWGVEVERTLCEEVQAQLPKKSAVIEKLAIPTWQNLMNEVGLVLAVDSSALHLCGTTSTRSFSIFGPTSSAIFKPLGLHHHAYQGKCPYGRTFDKTCPVIRTCPTGACIRNLSAEEIFHSFVTWWEKFST